MQLIEFVHDSEWQDLPVGVQNQAHRCLLDTIGTALCGRQTRLLHIIRDFAASIYGGQGAKLWLDGRLISPPGAALANGMTIDALDIHDGYTLTKGHTGAASIPAVLVTPSLDSGGKIYGQELLPSLGCAAITARRLVMNSDETRHVLGIAGYHGPR